MAKFDLTFKYVSVQQNALDFVLSLGKAPEKGSRRQVVEAGLITFNCEFG